MRARADFVRAAADVDDRTCFQLGVQAVGVVDEALLRVFAAFAAAVGAVQPGKDAVFPLFFEAGGVDAVVFGVALAVDELVLQVVFACRVARFHAGEDAEDARKAAAAGDEDERARGVRQFCRVVGERADFQRFARLEGLGEVV